MRGSRQGASLYLCTLGFLHLEAPHDQMCHMAALEIAAFLLMISTADVPHNDSLVGRRKTNVDVFVEWTT